jgi:hypothetical protein
MGGMQTERESRVEEEERDERDKGEDRGEERRVLL